MSSHVGSQSIATPNSLNPCASIETVVVERSPQKITFLLNTCYNPKDEEVKIKDYAEPAFCAEYCGATKNLCTVLQYYNSGVNDTGSMSERLCLDISPDADFPTTGGNCPEKDNHELVDFRDEIAQGQYLLVNKTGVTSTFPTICAYLRTG